MLYVISIQYTALAITGASDLSNPYVHSIFTLLLIIQLFEETKSLRVTSEGRTQFWRRIIPDMLFYPFYQ